MTVSESGRSCSAAYHSRHARESMDGYLKTVIDDVGAIHLILSEGPYAWTHGNKWWEGCRHRFHGMTGRRAGPPSTLWCCSAWKVA